MAKLLKQVVVKTCDITYYKTVNNSCKEKTVCGKEANVICDICGKDLCKEHTVDVIYNTIVVGHVCEEHSSIINAIEVIRKTKFVENDSVKIVNMSIIGK